jgi:hypothetical protein
MEGGAVGHNFERDPPRFGLNWFSGFRGEDLNVIFYQNMSNLYNQYKPPFKMAAVTKNRNFFNCSLLLYYKSNFDL